MFATRIHAVASLVAFLVLGCDGSGGGVGDEAASPDAPAWFAERAVVSGLEFVHSNGAAGDYHLPEIMGSGAAWVDYDGDGDLDLYLVHGGDLAGTISEDSMTDRLYRNDRGLEGGTQDVLRFVDVSDAAGLKPGAFGMGVASGDFDADGWVDLHVTAFGANRLLRNRGDGRFTDLTADAGAQDERWSVASTFFDYDGDGLLDLYVGNYLDYTVAGARGCRDLAGRRDYCGPDAYRGVGDRLFRNRGDGSWEDASGATGVGTRRGKSLGALAADLDGDNLIDLYVANDGEPNFLWRNLGDGRFEESALASGCAVSGAGLPQASMGVDAADIDLDGDPDLLVTHLEGEPNTLYRNDGNGGFIDLSPALGLGPPSWPFTGFGARWTDFDGDGALDLLVANGAVRIIQALADRDDPFPLHQPNLLFQRLGEGFVERSSTETDAFRASEVSRGAAFGDVDNDGDTDVLIVNNSGPVRLLINRAASERRWLEIAGLEPGRGRELRWRTPSQPDIVRRVATDGSYASASDSRVMLYPPAAVDSGVLEIRGGGRTLRFLGLRWGKITTIRDPARG